MQNVFDAFQTLIVESLDADNTIITITWDLRRN